MIVCVGDSRCAKFLCRGSDRHVWCCPQSSIDTYLIFFSIKCVSKYGSYEYSDMGFVKYHPNQICIEKFETIEKSWFYPCWKELRFPTWIRIQIVSEQLFPYNFCIESIPPCDPVMEGWLCPGRAIWFVKCFFNLLHKSLLWANKHRLQLCNEAGRVCPAYV